MLSEVRGDGDDEECGYTDPVEDEVGVHTDIGRDFSIPITRRLQLVKAEFQGVLVVGSNGENNLIQDSMGGRKIKTHAS